ncbi:L-serine dehydratase, beta chain [Paenibacillus sp. CECT 9249]|uniref:L-serine ammonia-lyase, iron-sulfur-dependent subunit beta n=1 Tax=Paenibacillus sp. CECT 9249 TaxID=2845385 RepID=UPI001E42650C|nr:L-serine ammonia-lyase, iron-sulfur-dependent subunit beta [Paenibacillus sp. CECT 9249]CAH0119985.1 L-serine dehydratase, beta chain [Paenibacillus sp. CECT 9249]
MRFKDVFSIIGPSMIGPSSSHTAGAVRLGRAARRILGGMPERADILFYGSFASTYRGHGTDLALVAGLLDLQADDAGIKDALELAEEAGMSVNITASALRPAHPNTAQIRLRRGEREDTVTGCSIGGGNIEVIGVNRFDVKFTASYPTLLIFHGDRPGVIAEVTDVFRQAGANIGYMEVDRKSRSGDALTVLEMDGPISGLWTERILRLPDVRRVCLIDLAAKEE